MKSHLFVSLFVGHVPVLSSRGVFCLSVAQVFEGESERHERFFGRFPGFYVGVGHDDFRVRHDLEINAWVWKFLSLRAFHDDKVRAARANVELGAGRGPRFRGKPLYNEFRIGPGAIDEFGGCIDNAAQYQLAVRLGFNVDFFAHISSFLFMVSGVEEVFDIAAQMHDAFCRDVGVTFGFG